MVFLGAIAGGTIFLGLPIARIKNPPRTLQGFLNAVATGILFFLLVDVLGGATAPVNAAVHADDRGHAIVYCATLIAGLTIGLLALVLFERHVLRGAPGIAPS